MGEAKKKMAALGPRPCVYCGATENLTDEHCPPKVWFAGRKPRMIIVRACRPCNSAFSTDDAEFVPYLSILAGAGEPYRYDYWRQKSVPILRSNRKLLARLGDMKRRDIVDEKGQIRNVGVVDFPDALFLRVMSRLVRALYFFNYRSILPAETQIAYQFVPDIRALFATRGLAPGRQMGETFSYFHQRDPEDATSSWWAFVFLKAHFWQVGTGREAEKLLQSETPHRIIGFVDPSS
ncbi:hypothetical protein [Prosthecomicrobium hirschii]|uniref:hypothetical protein n=1 Tax=Prosthecodimorpha hirschii TaxID=665126 RepID=UPI00128F66C2|nr:hypothetical protein [Prosthecomicrobium hirschii]